MNIFKLNPFMGRITQSATIFVGLGLIVILLDGWMAVNEYTNFNNFYFSNSKEDTLVLYKKLSAVRSLNGRLAAWTKSSQPGRDILQGISLLDTVFDYANLSGIQTITKLSDGVKSDKKGIRNEYNLVFSGDYPAVMQLLNKIETSELPLTVLKIDLDKTTSDQINCSMVIGSINIEL